MKTLTLAALLAALALPAVAVAKVPPKVTVCGADACVTARDRAGAILPLVNGGTPAAPPPTALGGFRVRIVLQTGPSQYDRFSFWQVPALGLVRGADGTWMEMTNRTARALRGLTMDLEPLPASAVPRGGRPIGDSLPPQSYRVPAPAEDGGFPWWIAGLLAAAAALWMVVRTRLPRPSSQRAA